MKKNLSILFASLLALLIIIGGIFAIRLSNMSGNYLERLELSYRGALGQLSENLEKATLTLKKIKYSSGDKLKHKATDTLIACCSAAKASAASLPFSLNNSGKIDGLLSITEDYSRYIGNKIAKNQGISEEELENFGTLAEYTERLMNEINFERALLGTDMENGSIAKINHIFVSEISLPQKEAFDKAIDELASGDEIFDEIIYDGPYSAHIERRSPLYLENKNDITRDEAIKIAADFIDTDASLLKCELETQGAMAAFEVTGDNSKILVTKNGGEISFAKISGEYTQSKLSYEDALKAAKSLLDESGFENLRETSYVISDNTCIINFYPYENGVILYPDLIKITIELNEGKMVEYEATGYLMNHHSRSLPSHILTYEEAETKLKDSLSVKAYSLALIPTEGKSEVLCYEFSCLYEKEEEKEELLIYINAENGEEEQLFFVDRSEDHIRLS